MNKILLSGNVVEKPTLSTTQSGVNNTTIRIAVQRRYEKDKTDFFNVKAWRGLADNCVKYLDKGSKVLVTGTALINTYLTKEGEKRQSFEVMAEDIEFIGSANQNKEDKPKEKQFVEEQVAFNDLPF